MQELREEVRSWLEISFENIGVKQLYINYPTTVLPQCPPDDVVYRMSTSEVDQQL
jgi:hypothetical protein